MLIQVPLPSKPQSLASLGGQALNPREGPFQTPEAIPFFFFSPVPPSTISSSPSNDLDLDLEDGPGGRPIGMGAFFLDNGTMNGTSSKLQAAVDFFSPELTAGTSSGILPGCGKTSRLRENSAVGPSSPPVPPLISLQGSGQQISPLRVRPRSGVTD